MPGFQKKRVLLVDDAVVVRSALSLAIAQDRDLEVAGTAANGRLALAKYSSVRPDIILLDIEMPDMDGLATVRDSAQDRLQGPHHHVQQPYGTRRCRSPLRLFL